MLVCCCRPRNVLFWLLWNTVQQKQGRAAKELYKSSSSWAGAKQTGAHLCRCKWAAFLIHSPCVAGLIAWRSLVCWPCCCAALPAARAPACSAAACKGTQCPSESRALEASNGTQSYQDEHSLKTRVFLYSLSHPKKRFGLHCVKIYTL